MGNKPLKLLYRTFEIEKALLSLNPNEGRGEQEVEHVGGGRTAAAVGHGAALKCGFLSGVTGRRRVERSAQLIRGDLMASCCGE